MRIYIKALLFLFFLPNVGKTESLESLLKQITNQITEVKTEKHTYTQQFEYDKKELYQISLRVIRVSNKKGKSETFLYQFNLGDLAANLVRRKSGKEMKLVLKTIRQQPFIKVFKEGKQANYESEMVIYCNNIDEARELEESVTKAIPLAKSNWESSIQLPTNNLPELMKWLKDKVKDVKAGNEDIQQEIIINDEYPDKVELNIISNTVKNKMKAYTLNWSFGNIYNPSLKINIKGEKVFVEGKTRRNLDFIQKINETGIVSFEDKFSLFTDNPNEAKLILLVVDKLLPLAKEEQEKRLPKINSKDIGLTILNKMIQSFDVGGFRYEQSINTDCQMIYQYSQYDDKKTENKTHLFHIGDLNKSAIKINIKKQVIEVTVPTVQKKKFIQEKKDDASKYYNSLSFVVPKVEIAQQVEHALKATIELCEQEYSPEMFSWFQKEVQNKSSNKTSISQRVKLLEDSPCQLMFQKIESGKKEELEETYEFNLADINEQTISLDVLKNQPVIQVKANNREKIFKYFNSKGKMDFQNNFSIMFSGIENGKRGVATLKALVKVCSNK